MKYSLASLFLLILVLAVLLAAATVDREEITTYSAAQGSSNCLLCIARRTTIFGDEVITEVVLISRNDGTNASTSDLNWPTTRSRGTRYIELRNGDVYWQDCEDKFMAGEYAKEFAELALKKKDLELALADFLRGGSIKDSDGLNAS